MIRRIHVICRCFYIIFIFILQLDIATSTDSDLFSYSLLINASIFALLCHPPHSLNLTLLQFLNHPLILSLALVSLSLLAYLISSLPPIFLYNFSNFYPSLTPSFLPSYFTPLLSSSLKWLYYFFYRHLSLQYLRQYRQWPLSIRTLFF